jgi:hypothetical protein
MIVGSGPLALLDVRHADAVAVHSRFGLADFREISVSMAGKL